MDGLPPDQLRRRCDPAKLPFTSTRDLGDETGLIGQSRALEAIRLSSEMPHRDFNLFVLGPTGTGRHTAVRDLLAERAASRDLPPDWVYVNNFEVPHKPRAIRLPAGTAQLLRATMQNLVDDLANDIPALFESEEYQTQRRAIEQELGERQEAAMTEFADRAKAEDVALLRTPMGYMLTAIRDGKLVKAEEYQKLDKDEQDRIDEKVSRLQEDLAVVLRQAPKLEKEHRKRVEELNAAMAERAVSARVAEVDKALTGIAAVAEYLETVRKDIIANAELFLQAAAPSGDGPFPEAVRKFHREPAFDRYVINVMVSHDTQGSAGAPVVTEDLPNLDRVTGRIEHVSHMGSLVTNFTMIRPGALHRANGGYLVLDARRILTEPFAWDALKRCLKNRKITITSMADMLSLVSTTSLEPDPIPLDLRVVLVGDRMLHALLVMLDPEFGELFKLQADFEDVVDRSDDTLADFARLVGGFALREGLRPMTAACVARLLDEATRLADDSEKLSLRLEALFDVAREADHYAARRGADEIGDQDIDRAVTEKDRRAARIKDRMQEAIARKTILIDTEGEKVGQINGLSVIGLGDYSFGRPSRITARTRMGSGKLVDIEREVELGGPLHSKGVMILSGYLTSTYALDVPFSLHASLVFEQSYGGIEGDSASSAELYALLSALSDLPIRQGLAVTGSVNQTGEVQAIGGVNEKIEGFFDTCAARGLTGDQGVLIPASNVPHLMLRDKVIDAAKEGKFRVIPVATIDDGIALLTGTEAGARGADGRFPEGSVNARVEARLRGFAETRRAFARPPGRNGDGSGA
ncbi:ATP-binding protein [Aestuariicoccus sp. MJ-SS9]|uniref:Lon protease family protein n=1 Tax=Aestuariicoccus sp. MJ-SS9 TaxID=3079855 RepID=UPI00290C423D|nr:ATP-binding protein [Aestuariicoccus sp. MJ-SS9]MDU8913899.1 ATP-binding protein [Aestuariicoccus sp. MJ-SS9]